MLPFTDNQDQQCNPDNKGSLFYKEKGLIVGPWWFYKLSNRPPVLSWQTGFNTAKHV